MLIHVLYLLLLLLLLLLLPQLQHWDNKLEKLSAAHRKAVWNACRMVMPNITELDPSCDQTSFRKTFANWSREPLSHLTSITVMFAAIGFLKECGLLKVLVIRKRGEGGEEREDRRDLMKPGR